MIDAHHHLWDLGAVNYPWLMARGVTRFFGNPAPIQRDYLMDEYRVDAASEGVRASVHIQVGAKDGLAEARWVQSVADATLDWPLAQVVFCDLTAPDLAQQLDTYLKLTTVRGVRQIVGRAPSEDATTGTNSLLDDPHFLAGLQMAGAHGLSFDLQLIPDLMAKTARILERAPDTPVALCHAGSPHDRSKDGLKYWADNLHRLSDLPHVWCKLSGLGMFDPNWTADRIRPIVETCLEQFGPDRVMFGSNFPVDKLYSTYHRLVAAYQALVPADMQRQVFGRTAAHFYRLAQQ